LNCAWGHRKSRPQAGAANGASAPGSRDDGSGFQDPYSNGADLRRYLALARTWARIRHDQGPSGPRRDPGAPGQTDTRFSACGGLSRRPDLRVDVRGRRARRATRAGAGAGQRHGLPEGELLDGDVHATRAGVGPGNADAVRHESHWLPDRATRAGVGPRQRRCRRGWPGHPNRGPRNEGRGRAAATPAPAGSRGSCADSTRNEGRYGPGNATSPR
jgi:hypothetical protein